MIEHVLNDDEFKTLVSGRTHWLIERQPIRITNLSGGGVMQTGEHRLILKVSGLSKENTKHVISLMIDFGVYFHAQPKYADKLKEVEDYATKEFPKATRGAFE